MARLRDQSRDRLRDLTEKGLIVGAQIRVVGRDPFDEPLHLVGDGVAQVIGSHVAQFVLVAPARSGE